MIFTITSDWKPSVQSQTHLDFLLNFKGEILPSLEVGEKFTTWFLSTALLCSGRDRPCRLQAAVSCTLLAPDPSLRCGRTHFLCRFSNKQLTTAKPKMMILVYVSKDAGCFLSRHLWPISNEWMFLLCCFLPWLQIRNLIVWSGTVEINADGTWPGQTSAS